MRSGEPHRRPLGPPGGTDLAVLLLVAAAVRGAYVWSVAEHPAVAYPMVDSRAYHEKALRILAGDWLGDRVFFQDPLYPYLLAGLYALFGPGSKAVLFAQALLGAGTAGLVYAIARRVFDRRCARLAGLLASFYGVLVYYDALLLKVSLTVFLITLALLLALRAAVRGGAGAWGACGLALGLASLTRGNYLLFVPVLLLWIALEGAGGRRGLAAAGVALGMALAIAPVAIRNHAVSGDWVLTTSAGGAMFYLANNRGNPTGRNLSPPFLRANPVYEEDDLRAEAERRAGRAMGPSELSRFWLREGLREIRADPGHFARHAGRKLLLFFNHYEIPDNQSYYFFREHVAPLLRAPLPSWGALLPLALCGMVLARRNRLARLLALFFASYAASVVIFFNMSRYRAPVVPVVIAFAAAALVELAARLRDRRWRAAAPHLLFLALAWPLVHLELTGDSFAVNHFNLGARHAEAAREKRAGGDAEAAAQLDAEARAEFRRALAADPTPKLRRELRRLLAGGRARAGAGDAPEGAPRP